jgi:hypothetical protein
VASVDQLLHSRSALKNLKLLAQSWERALYTVGGAINFQKCFWFLFHWRWKNGVAKLVSLPDTLTLKLTLAALLPKLPLNRNIARSIVFGPIEYGGLAIKTLYSIQSIGQLTLYVGHGREKHKTSTLLNISLSFMQLSVGTCTSVLKLPFSTYGVWLESSWLGSFWRFLQRASLSINLTPQWLPTHT